MAFLCDLRNLPSNVVFDIGRFAGPKATVSFALISKVASVLAPTDTSGLLRDYIEGCDCPGPLSAGLIGISEEDVITARTYFPDAAGKIQTGVITHVCGGMGMFAFLTQDGVDGLIEWRDIIEINGEVLPDNIPVFDIERVFMMCRQQTPDHIIERMLFFSIRARQIHLLREILRRCKPSPRVLGCVLLMVWFHESVIESVCKDIESDCRDCCNVLVYHGASIPVEVAVCESDLILSRKYIYYQLWRRSAPAEMFRQWRVANATLARPIPNDLDRPWFPLQLAHDGDQYRGPNTETIFNHRGQWIFTNHQNSDFFEDGRQFYSMASSDARIPALGSLWSPFPDNDYEAGYRFLLRNIVTSLWVDALNFDKQKLVHAAKIVMCGPHDRIPNFWQIHRQEAIRLMASRDAIRYVLQFYPQGWEYAVGIFARTRDLPWNDDLDSFLESNGIQLARLRPYLPGI